MELLVLQDSDDSTLSGTDPESILLNAETKRIIAVEIIKGKKKCRIIYQGSSFSEEDFEEKMEKFDKPPGSFSRAISLDTELIKP